MSQTSQQNDKHQWPLGVCCDEITFFFCHFDWRNGFLLFLLSFCYCDVVQKRNFYVETKIHIWKGCTVFTSDLLIRWQLGHWPRTLDDRIYYSMKISLLLVLHILQFKIILRHLPCPGGKFYVWSLDLWFKKALQEYKCFASPWSRPLRRGQNEKNRL